MTYLLKRLEINSIKKHVFSYSNASSTVFCFQPVYGMTEILVAFSSKIGDSLEQMTRTVGFLADNTEVCP